jgi:hypothetical protein
MPSPFNFSTWQARLRMPSLVPIGHPYNGSTMFISYQAFDFVGQRHSLPTGQTVDLIWIFRSGAKQTVSVTVADR